MSQTNHLFKVARITSPAIQLQFPSCYSTNPEYENKVEPFEVFKMRFVNAFDDPNIDGWWLRSWMQKLHLEDAVPPPEVVSSGLKACRRLNDFALAIRFLEAVKVGVIFLIFCNFSSNAT